MTGLNVPIAAFIGAWMLIPPSINVKRSANYVSIVAE